MIADYLQKLSDALDAERAAISEELRALQKNIDHIKAIVVMQQSYAKAGGALETIDLDEILEDALRFNLASLGQEGIQVRREYSALPPVVLDRHKLLQILSNLLHNARHALREGGAGERLLILRTVPHGAFRFRIEVEDTGCGIAPERLTTIFTCGLTTRKDGHGFGLHGSACTAIEMGGALSAHSAGVDAGARFTLELPLMPEAAMAAK